MSFHVVRLHTVTLFSFDFSLNFLKSCCLRIMLHVLFSLFGVPRGVKRVFAFPNDPGSSMKILNRKIINNVIHVVRFNTVTLFCSDFPSNFLKFLLLHVILHVYFFAWACSKESKESLLFPKFLDLVPIDLHSYYQEK